MTMTPSENNAILDLLNGQIESRKTPGLYYAFFDAEKILFEFCGGKANLKTGTPVKPSTVFYGFSATKTFTATAVMQLAEQGRLRLDERATAYWPEFPYGNDITIRHLLAHSAGIPNPLPIGWIHSPEDDAAFDDESFFRDVFRRHPKTRARTNEKFAYSNLHYVALGRVIERVSGMTYRQYVEKHILEPLNVGNKLGFVIQDRSNLATGYHKAWSFGNLLLGFFLDKKRYMGETTQGWKRFQPFYLNGSAYGGLIGNSGAFIAFIQNLLKTDGALLTRESQRDMFTENRLDNGRPSGMSLSWFCGHLRGHAYYCHAGGGGGYYCELRIYPESGRGSAVFMNRSGFSDARFLDKTDLAFMPELAP